MDDKELLEAAARAAGRAFHWDGPVLVLDDCGPGECSAWHPLTDDGAALRLAVKLNLHRAIAEAHRLVGEETDIYAATRRAIVRAAATLAPHP